MEVNAMDVSVDGVNVATEAAAAMVKVSSGGAH